MSAFPRVSFESFGLDGRLLQPPGPMDRVHHHHEIELNYLFSGAVTYLQRGEMRSLPLQRLTVFWGAPPHRLVTVASGSEMAWITLPLAWLLQWNLPAAFLHALMDGEWWMEQRDEGEAERYPVRSWVRDLRTGSDVVREALLLELRAGLIRLATHAPAPPPSPGPVGGSGVWQHVERMARFMAEHFTEAIGVGDVARAVRLHPKYAMGVFRDACGTTVHDYLTQHRIAFAQRLLITGEQRVAEIAFGSGFQSSSVFYDVFVRRVGCAPGEFRRRHRQGVR